MTAIDSGKVLWKVNSSRHEWRGGELLRRFLAIASRLGLIGAVDRVSPDLTASQRVLAAATGEDLAAALIAAAANQGRVAEITLSGNAPAPWELFWNVYPYDCEQGWVDGMNTLWLTFERARVPDRSASDALREAFLTAHTADDTEYAVIHPYDHWSDFAETAYPIPVTINLMFRGVYWANFFGPGHLDEFDRSRLRDLDAYEVRWLGDSGLFVIATPDLASADTPAAEAVLRDLTQRFRRALGPQSRWP